MEGKPSFGDPHHFQNAQEPAGCPSCATVPSEQPQLTVSHAKPALNMLPSWTRDSFSCFRPLSEDDATPHVHIVARRHATFPPPQPPQMITTDVTKCLIRALRAKPESIPLQSAAIPESLAPSIVDLQHAQRRQQRAQLAKNASRAAVARRRQLASSSNGTIAPSAIGGPAGTSRPAVAEMRHLPGSSGFAREGSTRGEARTYDRMTFGSIPGNSLGPSSSAVGGCSDAAARPVKRARPAQGWGSLPRDRRQICIRVSLAAALRHSPSHTVSEMHRIWTEDPSRPQRVTSDIRRELAESVMNWNIDELMSYVDGADMCGRSAFPIGRSTSRCELAARVKENLLPDTLPRVLSSGEDKCALGPK